jgi:hypothetical protein
MKWGHCCDTVTVILELVCGSNLEKFGVLQCYIQSLMGDSDGSSDQNADRNLESKTMLIGFM